MFIGFGLRYLLEEQLVLLVMLMELAGHTVG